MKIMTSFLIAVIMTVTSACSTRQIIRDAEYKTSEASFRSGDITQAIERFPTKERHGFVTSIEKSWLSFWDGGTNHDDLMKQAKTLDERKYISVLRETQYFFYNETEDGYIPAEHEIIIMHLINAMFFMRTEKWDEAHVEARKATFFLQNYFKEDQSHFDDPALRIWLAGVWASLGQWQDAQVDFRKAYELSKDKALLPLLKMDHPPKNLSIIFTGAGPQVTWKAGSLAPTFNQESQRPSFAASFQTLPWFLRHEKRNSEIRSVVMNSNYMAQYYGLNTSVGAEKSIGYLASGTVLVAGLTAAVAVLGAGLYLLSESSGSSGEAVAYVFGAGLLIAGETFKKSGSILDNFDQSSAETKKQGLENLKTYRFVRYLPSWISVTDSIQILKPNSKGFTFKSPRSSTSVLFLQDF